MKKMLICLSLITLLITGCGTKMNSPTKRVEELLGKYQSMDSEVLSQLNDVVEKDPTMSSEQKEEYRSLMEKQYQNMSYKIKDEEINEDEASVLVEIEVYDYATSIVKSKEYYKTHEGEFNAKEENDTSNTPSTDEDKDGSLIEKAGEALEETADFIDYKIKQLKNVTDKVKYEITFHLTRIDNEWVVDDISDVDRQKIHGLYNE